MLEVEKLTAIRDERVLFDQLSFQVMPGDIVQIVGENGAGKTTLLRIMAGLAEKESGTITWKQVSTEKDREAFYQALLFIGHLSGIKRELSAQENLAFYHSLHTGQSAPVAHLWDVLAKVGLAGSETIPVSQLSAGQQRRVALARLWLSPKPLWILDEPLTAIDRAGSQVLAEQFLKHTESGGMIVFTTHQPISEKLTGIKCIRLG